ncbi:thioredoxin domain-containing protein [Candidatus Wolfebacteria bacterium]|nr:thioredoxin domain-containing protein [Candidatus Wolfebacteria bacterium]NCO44693.1 thioredoxin domain-containing protein [Candidatus Wolfebacteria bacterium]
MDNSSKKYDNFLAASILVAAILISGSIIYAVGIKNSNPRTANMEEAVDGAASVSGKPQIDDDVVLGDSNAPLTVFIFSDYQCPFCGKFYQEAEYQIRENYVKTGKVNMVYKDLAFLGQESTDASEAANCAKDQGKYWDYHDAIFEIEIQELKKSGNSENTGNLNRDTFKKIATDLKMNVDDFLSCYDSKKYASEVSKDMEEAKTVFQQFSAPTIFVGDKMIQGAYPYASFSQAIDEALKK